IACGRVDSSCHQHGGTPTPRQPVALGAWPFETGRFLFRSVGGDASHGAARSRCLSGHEQGLAASSPAAHNFPYRQSHATVHVVVIGRCWFCAIDCLRGRGQRAVRAHGRAHERICRAHRAWRQPLAGYPGIAPSLLASRANLADSLKESGRGSTSSRARGRVRGALVVAEISLALVLLVGAGLLVKNFQGLLNVNESYSPQGLLTMNLTLPRARYATQPQQLAFFEQVLR